MDNIYKEDNVETTTTILGSDCTIADSVGEQFICPNGQRGAGSWPDER
jgi:hypothetical protein